MVKEEIKYLLDDLYRLIESKTITEDDKFLLVSEKIGIIKTYIDQL